MAGMPPVPMSTPWNECWSGTTNNTYKSVVLFCERQHQKYTHSLIVGELTHIDGKNIFRFGPSV